MSKKINISIIGATGYTGLELLRLLAAHDDVEIKHLSSASHAGDKIGKIHPHLEGLIDLEISEMGYEKVASESDLVFLALPHNMSKEFVPMMIGKTKIIDLSADFRLKEKSGFIYGLPEANKNQISTASNVANPGCFATACQLALLPIKDLISTVDVCAITGSSGSGKMPQEGTHHPIRSHNVKSYKIGVHQHIPEIVQTLGIAESEINFVPTSGPFVRGIHLTAFVDIKNGTDAAEVEEMYASYFQDAPFIRMKKEVQLAEVVGSNFCDISLNFVNGKLVIQAVIDNLIKGASGSAIQNMNIMFGLNEKKGLLNFYPLFP